jgi:putative membrane-bound dehydrogenase-like protein
MRSLFAVFSAFLLLSGTRADEGFPEPVNNQQGDYTLTPAGQALKMFKLPAGFEVSLFAGEPDVRQPIALTTDARGRLWVAECYSYDDRSNNYSAKQRDRVVIYEDSDNDGRFDKRKVFWDKAWKLTSVEVGFGGVWVLCAPNLMFIPDRDGDDVPDGEPEVILDGWNDDRIRHNIVNGLKWGPDGWLYGRHGIMATSEVGPPDATVSQRISLNTSIWRVHPVSQKFEVVCNGGTNPWGHDWDEFGELFWINTVIGHFWHGIPGGYFKRMHGEHLRPNLYEYIDQHADHYHWDTRRKWSEERSATGVTDDAGGGHAHCGMMIYLGDNWPSKYRGELFALNLLGHRINQDHIEREGNGFIARHRPDLIHANDEWFRGIDLIYGPDGGVFVADWSDVGECHENDGIHRTSGRIWKITNGKPKKPEIGDVARLPVEELVRLQGHANEWYSRQARKVLQERAAAGVDMTAAHAGLVQLFMRSKNVATRLRGMWGLHVTGGAGSAWLRECLRDREERVRVWAVRLLTQESAVEAESVAALVDLARVEKSGLVRLYLAAALQRISVDERILLAEPLLARGEDSGDHNQPLLVWYGLEPLAIERPRQAIELAAKGRMGLVSRYLIRRITERINEDPGSVDLIMDTLLTSSAKLPLEEFLRGMTEALKGWRKASAPKGWRQFAKAANESGKPAVRDLVRELSVVFGDGRALDELREIVSDHNVGGENRRAALAALIENRPADLPDILRTALKARETEGMAVRGLAVVDDKNVPKEIVNRFSRLGTDDRTAAISTLSSRAGYARYLLNAVSHGQIPRGEIKAFHVRQIRSFGDAELDKLLIENWGDIRQATADKVRLMERYRAELTGSALATADLSNGRQLFNVACSTCHTLFGEGRQIGPDITGANRDNLAYLLENIVAPSAMISGDFKVTTITLKDGRVLNGVLARETPRSVELQTPVERISIELSEIRERLVSDVSLMPEGLLETMTSAQVRDLFAYLMSPRQVSLP